jgi:ABC-type transport system substrate-binding protein
MTMISRRSLLGTPALLTALGPSLAEAQAAQPLRIAMSIGDVPRLWGGPEAGFEGVRFGSYFVYDALALWDLSKADAPSGLMPGLATSWRVDEADRRRWIIELRQGVKFHDGTPFDADAAIWNFDSILNNQVPQFEPTRSALVDLSRFCAAPLITYGPVAYLCRSDYSFMLLCVRRPGGFCPPTLNAFGAGYKSR